MRLMPRRDDRDDPSTHRLPPASDTVGLTLRSVVWTVLDGPEVGR
jgi:hypothetical protein